jgi:hypothetical protein
MMMKSHAISDRATPTRCTDSLKHSPVARMDDVHQPDSVHKIYQSSPTETYHVAMQVEIGAANSFMGITFPLSCDCSVTRLPYVVELSNHSMKHVIVDALDYPAGLHAT